MRRGFLQLKSSGLLYPLGILAVGSAVARWWPPFVVIGLVLLAGAMIFFYVSTYLSSDPRLVWIVCGSYLLRSAIAILFFVASAFHLPFFSSLQFGDGFWRFAPDAQWYHSHALVLLRIGSQSGWIYGVQGEDDTVNLFGGLIALIYWWFIPHPLVAIAFNVWMATATIVLAFEIGRYLSNSTGIGLMAAVFVGCWPSSLLWSTQLLREPLLLFLVFLIFSLVMHLVSLRARPWLSTVLMLGMMYVLVFVLAKSRYYSGWMVLGSFGVVGFLIRTLPYIRQRVLFVCCFIVIGLGVAMGITRPFWLPLPSAVLSWRAPAKSLAPAAPPISTRPLTPLSKEGSSFIEQLHSIRQASVHSGGNLLAPAADISTIKGLLRQLPATLAAAVFAPYPWRWFLTGTTGVLRRFAAVEVVLLILLVPGFVVGAVSMVRRRSLVGSFMLMYGLVIWGFIALVVANEGSLFRLRLQGVLPVLVAAIGGGGLRIYARFLPSQLKAFWIHRANPGF